jgi:ankyrin repeat protein
LNALQHCFPPDLHRFLNELPKTLDETYNQILKRINEVQRDNAHHLLQYLAVAARPLHVEEIAELLAFDCRASSSGGVPKSDKWRWVDHEEAILSTCSGLITIVRDGDSRVIQFSHFSAKEYLKSPRLARLSGDISQFHIDLDAAHTIMTQACLGTLLRLDEHATSSGSQEFPLIKYAAQHWVEHARFENVSSRVQDEMDALFDLSKPHFAAWLRVHDPDERWFGFSYRSPCGVGSPLYYAAFCGFHDLAERLIMKQPEPDPDDLGLDDWDVVNEESGWIIAPLPAALYKRHFRVANLLHRHGADVFVQGSGGDTPLHVASSGGHVDIMRWLIDHGANADTRNETRWSPLHYAALLMHVEAVQLLLDHNADINLRDGDGGTPLFEALYDRRSLDRMVVDADIDLVRLLLKRGADPNISDYRHSTPLHRASSGGWLEIVRLLLSYGAKVDEKDKEGKTPFQVAASMGHLEVMKFLSEHDAVVDVRDHTETTPLHEASNGGHIDVMLWLLNYGADANARQRDGCTPLHQAAYLVPEAVQVLLEHNAYINLQNDEGKTPLHMALRPLTYPYSPYEGKVVDIVRRLLEYGADLNTRDHNHSTALHQASSCGSLEVARLLLSYGANIDEKDWKGRSPFQLAALEGHREMTKLLLEYSAVP